MKIKPLTIGILAILVVGGLVGALFASDMFTVLSVVTTPTFIQPQWGRLECAPQDFSEDVTYEVHKDGTTLWCGVDETTDKCIYTVNPDKGVALDVYICPRDSGPGQCLEMGGEKVRSAMITSYTTTITNSDKLWVESPAILEFLLPDIIGTADKTFTRWKLYKFYDGAKAVVNERSCYIPSAANSNIAKEETGYPNPLQMTGGEGTKWINYITKWTFAPPFNVFTHSTYGEVYCEGTSIYDIATIQMKDNKGYKVDPGATRTPNDPPYYDTIGNLLGRVDCCPNEPNCGDDFEYHPKQLGEPAPSLECWSDAQCTNTGRPVAQTSTTYKTHNCEAGKCVWSAAVEVECVSDAACEGIDPNAFCDTTTYKCIKGGATPFCGDNVCTAVESKQTCPEDCGYPDREEKFQLDIERALAVIMGAVVFGAIGYVFTRKKEIAIAGGLLGAILIWWWTGMAWWEKALIGLGIGGSMTLIIVLVVIGVLAFSFRGVKVGK